VGGSAFWEPTAFFIFPTTPGEVRKSLPGSDFRRFSPGFWPSPEGRASNEFWRPRRKSLSCKVLGQKLALLFRIISYGVIARFLSKIAHFFTVFGRLGPLKHPIYGGYAFGPNAQPVQQRGRMHAEG